MLLKQTSRPDDDGLQGALWVSSDEGATWIERGVPCATRDDPALIAVADLASPEVLIDCFWNSEASEFTSTQENLYTSSDGGAHWSRQADPGTIGFPDLATILNPSQTIFVVASPNNYLVYATSNGGRTWRQALGEPANGDIPYDLDFVTGTTGYLLGVDGHYRGRLFRTTDAGQSWTQITTVPR